jgi:hypothetical protein
VPATKEGKTFEEVVEIRKDEDGRYCIVSIAGVPLEEDREEEDEGSDESLGGGAKSAMKGAY